MQTLIKVIKFTVSLIAIGVSMAHCLAAQLQELDLIPAQNISQSISLTNNSNTSYPTGQLGSALIIDNLWGLSPGPLLNEGQVTMNYIPNPGILSNSINLSLMNMTGGVAGYPEIQYGYSPNSTNYSNGSGSGLVFPQQVANLINLESSGGFWLVANYTIAPSPPPNPIDFTYDIWITSSNAPASVSSTTVELMIWLYGSNLTPSGGTPQITGLLLPCLVNGQSQSLLFDVYASTNNPPKNWATISFELESPISTGSIGVDVSKIVSFLGADLQTWYNNPAWNQTSLSNFYVLDVELGSEFKGNSLFSANYGWAVSNYYFLYPTPQLLTTNTLNVASSNPGSGVSITVSPNDTGGNGNGSTPFARTYTNNTQVTLTAPSTAGGNNFQKWQQNSADYSTSLSAAITITTNYTMTAVYTSPPSATYTLTVASSNPNSGVSITASPNDNFGQGGGSTPFMLTYNSNKLVYLTAPATAGGNNFQTWQLDGVTYNNAQSSGLTMNGNHTMTAVYGGIGIIGLSGNLSFGTVQAGASAVRTFTIQSQGGYQPLHVSGITYPPGFSGAWSGTIPIGSSTNVVVTFAPTTNGFYSGLVTVNSDATLGSNSIAASGTGVVAPPPPPVTPFSTGPFTVIYSFPYQSSLSGPWAYGVNPETGLVQGTNGDFYGSTSYGGSYGDGVIFRMNAAGSNQLLYVFPAYVGQPGAQLTLGSDGNLYGITQFGGAHGHGSVFKMASGVISTNYSFAESSSDHSGQPVAPLIQGRDGVFYGTTYWGWDCLGSAFAVTSTGTFTLLTDFDCSLPGVGFIVIAPLIQGSDGNLYGTTLAGGTNGLGTVFKLTLSGALTPLYSFTGGLDGAHPQAGLVVDKSGYLYGTTSGGGSFGNGTIFKMATNGKLIWVVSFNGTNGSNGGYGTPAFLEASLIQASDGNLYGVAPSGGTFGDGTVFQISTNGLLAVLHSFQGSDGANPFGLMQGRDGNLYGTTWEGGTDGGGTVFRLVIPLGTPSVTTTGGVLNINWNAVPGQTYQVQYSTDLRQTNWVVLISAITPTNLTATATDAVGPDSQRFYRIVEFPEAW